MPTHLKPHERAILIESIAMRLRAAQHGGWIAARVHLGLDVNTSPEFMTDPVAGTKNHQLNKSCAERMINSIFGR
jgi:hypothetical protein